MCGRWHRRAVVVTLLGVAFGAGCTGEIRGAKLKGQVLMNGQPLKAQPGEQVWVQFAHTETGPGGQPIVSSGRVQKDGMFAIEGQLKKGTPPGKYVVTVYGDYTSGDGENRFAHLSKDGKSPFVVDVTDREGQNFVIDVGAKTATAQ